MLHNQSRLMLHRTIRMPDCSFEKIQQCDKIVPCRIIHPQLIQFLPSQSSPHIIGGENRWLLLVHHPLCAKFPQRADPLPPFPGEILCLQATPYTTLPVLRASDMMERRFPFAASTSSGVKARISIGIEVTPIALLTASVLS